MSTNRPQKRKAGFRAELDELGLTQAEFARILGVSQFTVSRWGRRRPPPKHAVAHIRLMAAYSKLLSDYSQLLADYSKLRALQAPTLAETLSAMAEGMPRT